MLGTLVISMLSLLLDMLCPSLQRWYCLSYSVLAASACSSELLERIPHTHVEVSVNNSVVQRDTCNVSAQHTQMRVLLS
jgi:hypothetical protein